MQSENEHIYETEQPDLNVLYEEHVDKYDRTTENETKIQHDFSQGPKLGSNEYNLQQVPTVPRPLPRGNRKRDSKIQSKINRDLKYPRKDKDPKKTHLSSPRFDDPISSSVEFHSLVGRMKVSRDMMAPNLGDYKHSARHRNTHESL